MQVRKCEPKKNSQDTEKQAERLEIKKTQNSNKVVGAGAKLENDQIKYSHQGGANGQCHYGSRILVSLLGSSV